MKIKVIIILLLAFNLSTKAQQKTNTKALLKIAANAKAQFIKDSIKFAIQLKNNAFKKTTQKPAIFYGIDIFGEPIYITTTGTVSAQTISTNKVKAGGLLNLNLDGTGIHMAIWDVGSSRTTHQAFNNTGTPRLIQKDNEADISGHPTAVASVMIDGGVDALAQGMAHNGTLFSYNTSNDASEMATEASQGMILSNHSYGSRIGWYKNSSGTWSWSNGLSAFLNHSEDYNFGYYDTRAQTWDNIVYNAPNYVIVKAAGNDRDDGPVPNDSSFQLDGPYDCLPTFSVAKNIITVGAVKDILNGYNNPSDVQLEIYSSYGPTDDGRIKPDIVANGQSVRTAYSNTDTQYINGFGGTSAASPSVAGSIALVQQHYKNLFGSSNNLSAASIKAIVLHTADEAGDHPGPDYAAGWGIMNTASAVQKITESVTNSIAIKERLLANNQTITLQAIATGAEPIKATVVWTDPAGTPISNIFSVLDNPTKMLVNDLDFKIELADGTEYFPWKLDGANPANAATNNTKNDTDNVEGISVGILPAGTIVTLTIKHTGTLTNNEQWFSLVTTGLTTNNNDNFANAYEFNPSEYSSPQALYTTEIGTPDGNNYSCTMHTPKNNVWFKFTAVAKHQSLFVLSDGPFGTIQKPILSLWNNDGSTQLSCHQGTTANKAYLHADNLTLGETYYVAVDNTNSNETGSFTLFADASELQSETSTSGTLEPGTIRYNSTLGKFQGWNGTMWKNFN